MKRRCDQLRERALRAGLGSPEASAWREHCQSCPDCRTEQFLLETLQRQAQSQRQHLGRRELNELLGAARRCQERRRRAAPVKAWIWRAASVCLLAGVTWHFGQMLRSTQAEAAAPMSLTLAMDVLGPSGGNYRVPLSPGGTDSDGALTGGARNALPRPLPALATGHFVQDLMLDLRDEIEERRQELIRLQDRDAGGWERDDAWECVLPSNLAVA